MYRFWVFCLVLLSACENTATGPSTPSYFLPPVSDTVVPTPPPPPPAPAPTEFPFGAPKNISWPESGPINWTFAFPTLWGFAEQDTMAFRYGWKSEKFVVNPGECFGGDCQRSPVFERKEYSENKMATEGDEYWYAWSFYFPKASNTPNVPNNDNWVFLGQFIQTPADSTVGYDSIWMFFKRWGRPFCMVFDWVKDGSSSFDHCSGSNIELISNADFAGKWHDIVMHVIWSENKGLTEIWVDGELKGVRNGYTLTPRHKGIWFKYGIYRTSINRTTTIYYDELRKGKKREEVDIRMLTAP